MQTFKNLTKAHRFEEDIKKSTFIGICFPIDSIATFEQRLSRYCDPQATHNCWAYRLGQLYRFNDDGEPSGTAGKPMLAAIDGAGFDAVGALVIRHYGGIKLGTGGLARAYGGVIAKSLQSASFKWHVPKSTINLQVPFAYTQSVHAFCEQFNGHVKQESFNTQGADMRVTLPDQHIQEFKESMQNTSKGQINFPQSSDS
ncbi:IMPACT family protein [Marinicella gelatinilytica]|uniref:IMPACT family protein n=1 Tax=Marinicella gelatinilytica TaxID=2996017 RepID=UPI0022610026|nr:YigZ family protein [Marinicella gelatinilytica]MCX7544836.1 IMPACT family protein [Marinicella gelatinilytica]